MRTQTSQGAMAQTYSNNPPLEEPAVGVGVIPAARSSPVADPLETGPPLSSERYDMARVMGPACVAAQREPFGLPERILNTMAEARAPSTRCRYALKWSVFSTWYTLSVLLHKGNQSSFLLASVTVLMGALLRSKEFLGG